MTAHTPQEAIEILKVHGEQIKLVLSDVVLPGMNGQQLADQLRSIQKGLKVLYMSGYTANIIAHKGVLESGVNFIHKPFTKASLAEKIEEVLSRE